MIFETARLRAEEIKMIEPQTTSATVGRRSNSLGHIDKKPPSPVDVVLYTFIVSALVPTIVNARHKERIVRPVLIVVVMWGLLEDERRAGCVSEEVL